MKISIITCTYNSERYLKHTIEGVENQELDANIYEHIFIDGNSTDKTISIIEDYQKRNPKKNIILEKREAKWIYHAMNEAIKIAKWEYLLYTHSDDYLVSNTLSNYLQFIEKTGNKDFYYARFNAIDENWVFLYNAPHRGLYKKWLKKWIFWLTCYMNQSNVIHKKSLHKKFWLFNEDIKIVSDKEFFIKLAGEKVEGIFFDKTISCFRVHDSWTSNNPELRGIFSKERKYIWNKYYGIERYIYIPIVKSKLMYKYIKRRFKK